MKNNILLSCLLLWCSILYSTVAGAQSGIQSNLPVSDPEQAGFSTDRLQRIHQTIDRHIARGHISGAVTLVARKGDVVHFEAHGLMNQEANIPMRKDALFVLASMTKPITGVAVLMLIEEGKIRLNDPVSKYIPEFKAMKVAVPGNGSGVRLIEANREITIRDLLTHTSGLGSGGPGMQEGPEMPWPVEKEVNLASHVPRWADMPLDFQPGTCWSYSPHAGMDVLARIVEVASSKSFTEFLQQRIFEPLDMKDTFFVLPENRQERLAAIYEVSDTRELIKADYSVIPLADTYFSGAIGLISSVEDYYKFAQMLLGEGWNGRQLLSPRAVDLYVSNQVGDMFEGQLGRPEGIGFGLTVEMVEDAVRAGTFRSNGSFGWSGSYGTYFSVDPKQQLVAILMIHTSTSVIGEIQDDFDTSVMQALIK